MSVEKLEKQIEKLMDERDALEENCDSLPQCQDENGCDSCEIFEKIEKIDQQIEDLEEQIELQLEEEE
ncbi:MAG: hypothetical protein BAJALOKI1v1_360016 [Promethearchaeota archaeon]|nr:MAG: hypothetical protein BAJALOKI1v1_360016 [Candidatus Lokiarchaeota archaeon]